MKMVKIDENGLKTKDKKSICNAFNIVKKTKDKKSLCNAFNRVLSEMGIYKGQIVQLSVEKIEKK